MNARIDPRIRNIRHQFRQQTHQREHIQRSHHHRIIALHHRLVGKQPQPVEREQGFNQQAAGEKRADKGSGKAGNQRNHRVAENVFPQNLLFRQTLGAGGIDILAADFFKKHVFRQHRRYRQTACHRSRNRQRHVPQIILDFARPRQRVKIIADQTALREPRKKAASAKQHQQHQTQHKRRYGITDQHHHPRYRIKTAAVAHRLGNAQRDTNQISQEKRPQAQAHRHRHFLFDQLEHGFMMEKTLAQIKTGKPPHHIRKPRQRRLVETVQRIQRRQIFRTDAVAVFHDIARRRIRRLAADRTMRQLLHHLLHRPARHKLDNGKSNRQNPQQRGD